MPKCGLCGKEVDEAPEITEEGRCSECGAELTVIAPGDDSED